MAFYLLYDGNKIKKIFALIFIIFSEYRIVRKENGEQKNTLFFISHEKTFRKDHSDVFYLVYSNCNKKNNSISYVEYQRILSFKNINLNLIKELVFLNFSISSFLKKQFLFVYQDNHIIDYDKIIVFCDVSILQNFIINKIHCDKKNVPTLSMQHGFYPLENSKYWRRVYLASVAKVLAVWDEETILWMNKFKGIKDKKYIKCGPINLNKKIALKKFDFSNANTIAVYSGGKDQIKTNEFLYSLIRKIKISTNKNISLISHPNLKFYNRLLLTFSSRINHLPNGFKNKKYDFHIMLNSSVWVELERKGESYFRLDYLYQNNNGVDDVLSSLVNNLNQNSLNYRIPFLNDNEAIDSICNYLSNQTGELANDI
jgi:hypothetical protein